MNKGIDYGMGQSNIDRQTGIRYGVISQHTVGQAWYDNSEPELGEPMCPDCAAPVKESHEVEEAEKDYWCESCQKSFWADRCFPDEPLGYNYQDDEYTMTDCLDTDIMVIKSPYYTHAQFCSPCVPGAGNLDNPCDDGPKTYCLGHDWFDDNKAPYKVYSVDTGEEVKPQE